MDKYINSIYYSDLNYYDGYETFCYQNCLRLLLQAEGYRYPELYINAAMTLRYIVSDSEPRFQGHENMRGLLPEFLSKVIRVYEHESAEQIFKKNCDYLCDKNAPIIVGVDTFFLPYASNYKKNHARHTLILCGYDMNEGVVYVVDWYSPWFYHGPVLIEDFIKARDSQNADDGTIFSGAAIQNNWAYLEPFSPVDKDDLLREMLQISMDNFFLPKKEAEGIDAVSCMSEYIKENENINCEALYKDSFYTLHRFAFFKQYLLIYNEYRSGVIPEHIFNQIDEAHNDWEMLQFLFMKQMRREKKENLLKIAAKLDGIYQKEKELGSDMEGILGVLA